MDEARVRDTIEAAYDAAVAPERWMTLLSRLAGLFDSPFVDAFARTQDRTLYRGLAFGLDPDDYQHGFLDTWVKRNVWSSRRPVRDAGEIITTRQIMPKAELVRSEMYNEYLAPRDLHEGLRLSIWTSDDWIQDMSLLRPWSAGPFGASDIALAGVLMPHLQRAAAIARRLGESTALSQAGLAALDALGHAVILLDDAGKVVLSNRAADRLFTARDGLGLDRMGLLAANATATRELRTVIGQAGRAGGNVPVSGQVRLPRPSGAEALTLLAMPLGTTANATMDWTFVRSPTVLAMVAAPPGAPAVAKPMTEVFGLTAAEAQVAAELLAGRSLAEIAARTGRSVRTVRAHLAQVMAKTQTNRQSELIRKMLSIRGPVAAASGPRFD